MKVKVKEGKGPIAGYYGVKSDNEEFEVQASVGNQLKEADLVEVVSEIDTPADEPQQGSDMTKAKKFNKKATNRLTKEEKAPVENKEDSE